MSGFTLVVGNGNWPSEKLIETLIEKSNFIIALDGAADRFTQWDIVVGDMDSVKNPELYNRDKNYDNSDLAKALNKYDVDAVVGVEGGRLDHRLAAFTTLFETKSDAILYFEKWRACRVGIEGVEIELEKNTRCAIFAFGKVAKVTLSGTKYELSGEDIHTGSRGLGNLSMESTISVSHNGGDLLFIWEADGL